MSKISSDEVSPPPKSFHSRFMMCMRETHDDKPTLLFYGYQETMCDTRIARRACIRQRPWIVAVALLLAASCESFVPLRSASFPTTTPSLRAKNRKAGGAGGQKTKKGSQKPPKSKKTIAATSPDQSQQKKKKSAPPWQVMSTKEARKNVETEIQRRESIKAGMLSTDAVIDDDDNNNQKKTLSKAFLNEAESKLLNWRRFNPINAPAGQRFVGAFLSDRQLPPRLGVPEIAFLGRSNVGKSSLLNKLSAAATGDQARVGKTPGATASVNLYALVDKKERDILGWVDLPGFGYAKLSKETKDQVQQAAELYLSRRKELALGILLVDIRRTPSEADRALLAALYDRGVPIVVVATKRDKVSANQQEALLVTIRDELGLPENQPLAVSSVTGEGCRDLWRIILEACEICVEEFKSQYDENAKVEDVEEVFEDDVDYAYSQGYDWIHGADETILYEDEADYLLEDMEAAEEDEIYVDPLDAPPVRETLKSLKKRARDMERRGEV